MIEWLDSCHYTERSRLDDCIINGDDKIHEHAILIEVLII